MSKLQVLQIMDPVPLVLPWPRFRVQHQKPQELVSILLQIFPVITIAIFCVSVETQCQSVWCTLTHFQTLLPTNAGQLLYGPCNKLRFAAHERQFGNALRAKR